jgi:hypothetical protein
LVNLELIQIRREAPDWIACQREAKEPQRFRHNDHALNEPICPADYAARARSMGASLRFGAMDGKGGEPR